MRAAPKIATLACLAAAGLPVPAYVALPGPGEPTPAAWLAIDELLRGGPVIVRAALFGEDTADTSAAGLGTSIAGCRDRGGVQAALHDIAAALSEPGLAAYFGGPPRAQVLVQREVTGPWLAVVAQAHLRPPAASPRVRHVELHRREQREALAAGHSPALAGPLDLFPDDLRAPIARICDEVAATLPGATHGLDLELVADDDETIWVVQARPLTRPLHPGWPDFLAAARLDLDAELTERVAETEAGRRRLDAVSDDPDRRTGAGADELDRLPLPGLWTLDAEHNPAPLSPAHAGLIRRLNSPGMRVLAGRLYNRDRLTRGSSPVSTDTLRAALTILQAEHIPAARAELARIDRDTGPLAPLIDQACEHLRRTLATYATLPARPARLAAGTDSLSLSGRHEHLDVLPATWDIASPTLRDLSFGTSNSPPVPDTPPDDPDVLATLLGELDDHLFALGLAPLRRVYLRAAAVLGISADDIFLLTPDELAAALAGRTFDLVERRARHRSQAALFPPPQLHDGLPVPAAASHDLRGVAIGPVAEGPLHLRSDLAALLADPPPPDSVLAMPALTAQAAVVLRELGIRAVCCEHGGALSHAALMARELGLSALIGCRGCMAIPPGSHVRLDTRTGYLRIRT